MLGFAVLSDVVVERRIHRARAKTQRNAQKEQGQIAAGKGHQHQRSSRHDHGISRQSARAKTANQARAVEIELVLRFLGIAKLPAAYLPECVVVMRTGGASTAGWRSNVEINREDLRALRANGIWSCLPLIYLKYLFKIWGFVFKR